MCERENENWRKETDGGGSKYTYKEVPTVPLCHTNAAEVPKFAQMQMLPEQ